MERGLIFNIQRYSVQDGPGIRTTVFLKGCPLRCTWCHNPEGISPSREIFLFETLCIRCGECRQVCPHDAENSAEPSFPLSPRLANCELCGSCVEVCPAEARRMVGEEMTVAEVVELVLRDRLFYEDSGGGVTFSGGEPLMQFKFLLALLKACQAHGIHRALDTSGVAPIDDLLAVAPFVDLVLYDLKLMDDQAHQRYTGASNRVILENLQRLGRIHTAIWVRVPYVPGVNDNEAELRKVAEFAASVPGVRQVTLLPFHGIGMQKHQRLGKPQPAAGFKTPSANGIARAVEIFHQAGLVARAGG